MATASVAVTDLADDAKVGGVVLAVATETAVPDPEATADRVTVRGIRADLDDSAMADRGKVSDKAADLTDEDRVGAAFETVVTVTALSPAVRVMIPDSVADSVDGTGADLADQGSKIMMAAVASVPAGLEDEDQADPVLEMVPMVAALTAEARMAVPDSVADQADRMVPDRVDRDSETIRGTVQTINALTAAGDPAIDGQGHSAAHTRAWSVWLFGRHCAVLLGFARD